MDYLQNKNVKIFSPLGRKRSFDVEIFEKELLNLKFPGHKVVFIGISGAFSSGKSKVTQYFHSCIDRSATISEMSFFKPSDINYKSEKINKDTEYLTRDYDKYNLKRRLYLINRCDPNSYDYDKFLETLQNLSNGKKIKIPMFDENAGEFMKGKEKCIDPSETPLIIIDGNFIYKDKRIREMLNLKIYKEVEEDVRLSRLVLKEEKHLQKDETSYKMFFDIYEKFYKTAYRENHNYYKSCANIILQDYYVNEDEQLEANETLKFILENLNNLAKKERQ